MCDVYVHAYLSAHLALCFYLAIGIALAIAMASLFLLLALPLSEEDRGVVQGINETKTKGKGLDRIDLCSYSP